MSKETKSPESNHVESIGLLECPTCEDGIELYYDSDGWHETPCVLCNGTGMLDQKQSDGLRKIRNVYRKIKHSNADLNLG